MNKAVHEGRISKEPDGTIDPSKADAEWKQNTLRKVKAQGPRKGSVGHAQLLRTRALAKQEQLKAAAMEGKLADVAEVNAFVAGCITRARDIFLQIGASLRDRLAQETDAVRCGQMVDTEVERGLRELAEYRPHA